MNAAVENLLGKPFNEIDIVCFDIEATGLRKSTARIVEIAAVKVRGEEVQDGTFQSLCRPDYPIPPGAIRIHGITDADVEGAPDTRQVITDFFTWVGQDRLFAAHNAFYDVEVLAWNAKRAGVAGVGQIRALDTLGWSRRWLDAPDYKLGTLVSELEIDCGGDFHRALNDARGLAGIVASMIAGFGAERTPRDLLKLISPEALVSPPEISDAAVNLPPHLRSLEDALSSGKTVRIALSDPRRGNFAATVRPLFMLMEGDRPLMEAWSQKLGEVRTYPIEHIVRVENI